jgi:hypothetical protein
MDERQEYPTVASFTLFKENSNHLHGIIIAYYTTSKSKNIDIKKARKIGLYSMFFINVAARQPTEVRRNDFIELFLQRLATLPNDWEN